MANNWLRRNNPEAFQAEGAPVYNRKFARSQLKKRIGSNNIAYAWWKIQKAKRERNSAV